MQSVSVISVTAEQPNQVTITSLKIPLRVIQGQVEVNTIPRDAPRHTPILEAMGFHHGNRHSIIIILNS